MFDTLMVFLKEFFEKDDFGKEPADDKMHEKYPAYKELTLTVRLQDKPRLVVGDRTRTILFAPCAELSEQNRTKHNFYLQLNSGHTQVAYAIKHYICQK